MVSEVVSEVDVGIGDDILWWPIAIAIGEPWQSSAQRDGRIIYQNACRNEKTTAAPRSLARRRPFPVISKFPLSYYFCAVVCRSNSM